MRGYMAFVSKIIRLLQRLMGRRRRPLRRGRSHLGAKWGIGLLLCLLCGACSTHRRTTEVQIKREETKAAHERLVFDSIRVRDTLLVRTERDTVHVERHVHYEHAVRQRLKDTLVVVRTDTVRLQTISAPPKSAGSRLSSRWLRTIWGTVIALLALGILWSTLRRAVRRPI